MILQVIEVVTCRAQNPDIPGAGWIGAAHSGASGRDGVGQHRMPKERLAQERIGPCRFQGTEHKCFEQFFRSTNKRNPM